MQQQEDHRIDYDKRAQAPKHCSCEKGPSLSSSYIICGGLHKESMLIDDVKLLQRSLLDGS